MKKLTCVLSILIIGLSSTAWSLGNPVPKDPPWNQPAPTPAPTPPPSASFNALWNSQNSDAANWTRYTQDAVAKYGDSLYKGAGDIADFCPSYNRLGQQDRINFWVQLIAAMAKYESGFNPASRYTESTLGIDSVTGKQVVSEGLLQLSYQDEKNYKSFLPPGVCDFDNVADQQYATSDLRRSILNPNKNLTCAVGILNRQIENHGNIGVASGAYWAVIKTNSGHHRLAEIKAITNALSFCK
jgi:hypothetical protein